MDKQSENRDRTGHEVLPEADIRGTNEAEWRQTAESARGKRGEEAPHGGDDAGRTSEGSKSGRARALRRAHHAGRTRDELGGVRGKTK
ncbi:MAG: hypothetical protein ACM3NQ_11830 [Bacteroidales bacterium]